MIKFTKDLERFPMPTPLSDMKISAPIGVILFLCIFFQSCITREKCMERFPPQVATKDTTITVIRDSIVHDTIVIPGELMFWTDTMPCPELDYHKTVTKNHLTTTVSISKGVINVNSKSDSLQKVIDIKQRIIDTLRTIANTQIKERVEYRDYWYLKPACWISGISLFYWLVVIILWIVRKVYGNKS